MTLLQSSKPNEQPFLLLHLMGYLFLENLNNLVATALRVAKLCNCPLMLLFYDSEFLQSLFEHIGQFESFGFVLMLVVLHTQYITNPAGDCR
jgi:hypothetical protein